MNLNTAACQDIDSINSPSSLESSRTIPELPEGALYGLIGKIVALATENSEADPAAVALTSLTWAGAAFGNNPHVIIAETKQPPRLNSVLVGESSRARKGTSASPVKRIFLRAEELHTDLMPLNVTGGPLSTGEGLIYEVRDESDDVDSKTGEPLYKGVTDKRLLVIEQEFASPLKMSRRQGNSLSTIMRMAWDSGDIRIMTKTARIKSTGAHFCCIGHITKYELMQLLQITDIFNGFANRILWGVVHRKKLVPLPESMDSSKVDSLANYLGTVIVAAQGRGKVELEAGTIELWKILYPNISVELPGLHGIVTARAEVQIIRLALIYCLLDGADVIAPAHLRAAIAVWEYCNQSAAYIFNQHEPNSIATRILSSLKNAPMTQTELNNMFSGHISKEILYNVLQELEGSGKIARHRRGGGQGKGKSATVWTHI